MVIIGVDGASHYFVSELIAEGLLPNFARLDYISDSCLTTVFPPHTAPGWASIFTGTNPGEHGIYQFWELQASAYKPRLTTVEDFGREPLWRSLERHGLAVGLYHVPMTHPPASIRDGFMVTWPLSPTLRYAWPKDLVAELAERGLYYQSDLATMYREDDYLNRAKQAVSLKARTILHLLDHRPVDVLIAVFTEVDRVSHYLWGTGERPDGAVREIYQEVDAALGTLLDALPDETMVVVASDHGFGPCRADFNVNVALERAGLLTLKPAPARAAPAAGAAIFGDTAQALGASWFFAEDPDRTVDWTRTAAYMPAPGCFGVNLNRRGRQEEGIIGDGEARRAAAAVKTALEAVQFEGEQLFDVVACETVYSGPQLASASDLILLPRRWDIMASPNVGRPVWTAPAQAAIHRLDGIFFTRGIDRAAMPGTHVADVAPTCLHALDLPVAAGLDGVSRTLGPTEIRFEPPREIAPRRAERDDAGAQVLIEERLAQLGYL
jgi:predicted AlkP superfamily phosphohydrolase/phosphomutase